MPLQIKPAGAENWSVAQRGGAVVRNGSKLLGVGFFASLFGVTLTNTIVKVGTAPCLPCPGPSRNFTCVLTGEV